MTPSLRTVLWVSGFAGVLGTLGAAAPLATASAGERVPCSAYGPEYAAVEGSDTCVHVGGRVRVQLGTNAGLRDGGWSGGQTSSATLRSDGAVGSPSHLRIPGGPISTSPFFR